MSDSTTTTAHTLYREGDKVRYTFTSALSEEGRTHEVILTYPGEGEYLKDNEHGLYVVTFSGGTAGGVSDVELLERYGLPVKQIAKADHPELFAGRFRHEVTHALVFTSTSPGGSEVLTVPYAPSAEAGWQIGVGELTVCGLPADHDLLGEQGWWVNKDALREVGVKFPEDLPDPAVDPEEPEDPELERLRAEVERLTGENRRLVQADQDLRREVGTVAMRYAREHGWCDTVRDALSDMGIDPVEQKQEVWLTIRVRATGIASTSDPSFDWTRQSISVNEHDIAQAIEFDSDWDEVEVDAYSVEFDVDSVDPLDD